MNKIINAPIVFLLCCFCACKNGTDTTPLFTVLTEAESGIQFNNVNVENEQINILTYEYLYNGGGVAAGDINNDGLADLYFSSNNLENKLYLNKGNLKFEDITASSGTGCKPGWKTGVSMVDINADGWLDIYVCRSADSTPERRKNTLLINNGDLTFTDRSKEYGLDDDSYTTQAAFFDYDRDGDLDAFMLNHSLLQISNSFNISVRSNLRHPYVGNRLYRNDDGRFIQLGDEAGVYGPHSNYGLGIGVSDINNDGWPDVHVTNDYVDSDKLYMNQKNGTFRNMADSVFTHMSQFSMGVDIADINRDGFMDLLTLDMLPEDNKRQKLLFGPDRYDVHETAFRNGFHHQYMRNMLHLNHGDGSFSEIGQISGVSNTDWSWAALFADYDNDGWQDLFISNGYKRDFTNNDFLKYKADQQMKRGPGKGESLSEMIKKMPSNKIHNYIFRNNGDLTFNDMSSSWGFTTPVLTNGSVYTDLDNDGDLDLVMNNLDEAARLYENHGESLKRNYLKVRLKGKDKNTFGVGAKVTVYAANKMQLKEQFPVRGFQSSIEPLLHFGLDTIGVIDSITVVWPQGESQKIRDVKANQLLVIDAADVQHSNEAVSITPQVFLKRSNGPAFTHRENNFVDFKSQALLPRMYSTAGPAMASADVNGDGLEDVFIGGASGQPGELFLKKQDGSFKSSIQPAFAKGAASEAVDAIFFDMDNDRDQDLYVVSGGYEFAPKDPALQDHLYRNDGKGTFESLPDALPPFRTSKSCVRPADINRDGYLDLFVGGRLVPGRYPETPESYVLMNDGRGTFSIQTDKFAPELKSAGMVTDACWTDLNSDGVKDLVMVGEWMPVMFFVNLNGKLVNKSAEFLTANSNGWWNCITAADIDGDGDEDFLLGNFGMNNQMKPSDQKPVSMFYADYDNNGSVDPLLTYFIQDKNYPYANRDELTDQVPMFKKRFTDYESYSNATIETILNDEERQKSTKLTASRFETVILQNNGNAFTFSALPVQAQFAPVFDIAVADVNNDEHMDLILAGNLEKARVRTGKWAGNTGFIFTGDGKGNFHYVPQRQSGLSIQRDVRKILPLGDKIIFAINNSVAVTFERVGSGR